MVMRSNDSIHRHCTFFPKGHGHECSLFTALIACLFYRSKSRFHFGHSSYCDTAQLSRLCDWSLFQVTFSSFVPFWLHPSCLISTVQAGVDGVGNISLAHFGPLCFPQSIIGYLRYILHLCSSMIILHVPQFICSLACISLCNVNMTDRLLKQDCSIIKRQQLTFEWHFVHLKKIQLTTNHPNPGKWSRHCIVENWQQKSNVNVHGIYSNPLLRMNVPCVLFEYSAVVLFLPLHWTLLFKETKKKKPSTKQKHLFLHIWKVLVYMENKYNYFESKQTLYCTKHKGVNYKINSLHTSKTISRWQNSTFPLPQNKQT